MLVAREGTAALPFQNFVLQSQRIERSAVPGKGRNPPTPSRNRAVVKMKSPEVSWWRPEADTARSQM
jgi:hypothetical protein